MVQIEVLYMNKEVYYLNRNLENIAGEIWKDIPDCEGIYQCSTKGRIKTLSRLIQGKNGTVYYTKDKILKQYIKNGYCCVSLCKDKKYKFTTVNYLVAKTFIFNDDPGHKTEVNHKNEIKTDNRIENLEWCSRAYNNNYGTKRERLSSAASLPVVQLAEDNKIVKIYDSGTIAGRNFGYSQESISACCIGKLKHTGGYKWVYLKDYIPHLTEKEIKYYKSVEAPKPENMNKTKIVKLSLDGEFIAQYDSILEGKKSVYPKSANNISACCKGIQKTSGGYKWMYLKDYENLKNL